ncbi:hypothetical protein P691DRAFT_766847, partial [Macrolepiota fuliginosa MF-IS2]
MPRKAKTKPAGPVLTSPLAPPNPPLAVPHGAPTTRTTFQPKASTQRFLATMNQNRRLASQFTLREVRDFAQGNDDLALEIVFNLQAHMNFTMVSTDPKPSAPSTSTPEEMDTEDVEQDEFNDMLDSLVTCGAWCSENDETVATHPDCPRLIEILT